jgi:hypothetical protein
VAIAVEVFPIIDVPGWDQFAQEVTTGERAEAHAALLRRMGATREHIFKQSTPDGAMMILVWEGVEQEHADQHLADMVQYPQTDHERYLVSHVIPNLHGVQPTHGPPPQIEKVGTVET